MWLQNPELAKQGGQRVQDLLKPLAYSPDDEVAHVTGMIKQRGISLIELIMFIVIISVALVGILLVMNQVTRHSADPLIRKQAMAIAESLLEEVELQDFTPASGVTPACTATAPKCNPVIQTSDSLNAGNRVTFYHTVSDYDGFEMPSPPGIYSIADGTPSLVSGLNGYGAKVGIAAEALGTVAAGSAVRITVTVTSPQGDVTIDGYRTNTDAQSQ
jgi:MSHA pilin protein MshD